MDLRILVVFLCIQCALTIYIPSDKRDFNEKTSPMAQYADLLRDLTVIKLKLETMGYGPVYIEGPYTNGPLAKSLNDDEQIPAGGEEVPLFNESEILELIPVIIEQKRQGNVSPEEEKTLKDIFGDLWMVIEEEVTRAEGEEKNPILKALLLSTQGNDGRLKKSLYEANTNDMSPQQRLMIYAARMIRWYGEGSAKQRVGMKRRLPERKLRGKKLEFGSRRETKGTNRRRGRGNRVNRRPKRHNTDIYVDDNHGYDYTEDFEEIYGLDDLMTKPRSLRSSTRGIIPEYDSGEEEEVEEEQYNDDYD